MKLRNKKTGEIVNVESLGHADSLKEKYGYQVTLSWKTEYDNLSQCKDYNSLAELNADWEDVKEPLIKDEKIRKAVRAWAEASDIEAVYLSSEALCWIEGFAKIEFAGNRDWYKELEEGKRYTLAELCGEEEE